MQQDNKYPLSPSDHTLILHIGLPKCGSSAIQTTSYRNRSTLINCGTNYPSLGIIEDDYGPNHRRLTQTLMTNIEESRHLILDWIGDSVALGCHQTFISHEGMTNHYHDIRYNLLTLLAELSRTMWVKIVLVYRDLEEFFYAYYKQNILNPPINDALGYGSSLIPKEFFLLDRVQYLLNIGHLVTDLRQECPILNIEVIHYDKETLVENIFQSLGIETFRYESAEFNPSLHDYIIEQVRVENDGLKQDLGLRAERMDILKSLIDNRNLFSFYDLTLQAPLHSLHIQNLEILAPYFRH